MATESFTKQSWEKFPIWGSIKDVQEDDEKVVLAQSTVTVTDKDGKDAGEVLDQSSKVLGDDPDTSLTENMLGIKVREGTKTKSPYWITFKMVTTSGNQWEVDTKMKVKDVPAFVAVSTTTTT